MAQQFVPYEPKQTLLFPPSLDDWLADDHLARFVSETVDELDLRAFFKKFRKRKNGRGRIAYHPRMMLKVLIYAYSVGIFSSRKIAAGIEDLVALRYLAAGNQPKHRTIARFRQEYVRDFQRLFVQVVRIAIEAGLVKMGTIAVDGSKVKASASKHKAMSYERMKKEEQRLTEEIRKITKLAQDIDAAEDEEFGPDFRGDELPEELRTREGRLKKIREAKARLEKEQEDEDDDSGFGQAYEQTGRSKPKRKKGEPPGSKQSNFTDPESRIMGNPKVGFVQGYNTQIAVDAERQIVVAADVTQSATDAGQLVPMTKAAERNTTKRPKRLLADGGYRSEREFGQLEELGVDAHVSLGKGDSQIASFPTNRPATKRMHRKRQTKRSRSLYRKRKQIVEPVFGWVKQVLGFRMFSLRGVEKVRGEWNLICLALNLRRMATQMAWT